MYNLNMNPGKLIVFEGVDGSGKTTQIKLLTDYLSSHNISFSFFDFPQYGKTFFGDFVGQFLEGKFGHFSRINPYFAMFPYAGDRWQAKDELHQAMKTKKIILCNRYTSSLAYQLAKIKPENRKEFLDWSETLEYKIFNIPKENLVIFLYLPLEITQKLLEKRGRIKDQYEKDVNYLKRVEEMYLYLINLKKHWVRIDCYKNKKLLSPQAIHQEILAVLERKKYLI